MVRIFSFASASVVACLAVLWIFGRSFFQEPLCLSHGGFTHPDFKDVEDAFVQNILSGLDKGGAFSVYHKGEVLVDLWGGCADQESSKAWTRNTLTQVWSNTKGVTAIVLAHLVDSGRLNYTQQVAHYWPAFAQSGKDKVTVEMLLSHQAGLLHLERSIGLQEYADNWAVVEDLLAKQKPLWTPGSKFNYHALTWGMYADALVRKVDKKHRSVSQYFKEEIVEKFGDLDFHIGLPRDQFHRSTRVSFMPLWKIYLETLLQPGSWVGILELFAHKEMLDKSFVVIDVMKDLRMLNDAEMRVAGIPSSHGFGTARSLAQLFDYVANKGVVKGKRLISSDMVSVLSKPFTKDLTSIIPTTSSFAPLGMIVDPHKRGQHTIGHGGYGGQIVYSDFQHGVGVAYVTNFLETSGAIVDPRLPNVLAALYRCLDKFNKP